jgi:hypothetical protein
MPAVALSITFANYLFFIENYWLSGRMCCFLRTKSERTKIMRTTLVQFSVCARLFDAQNGGRITEPTDQTSVVQSARFTPRPPQ